MVVGTPDSWDQSISISSSRESYYTYCAWSPCSQFVAALSQVAVEIQDPLSSELLSTLTKPNAHLICGLAYSPDGHSLACLSSTALVIWDIQTGGVAKEIGHSGVKDNSSLVWSLDGRMVGTINGSTVHIYEVTSGTTRSPGTLQSRYKPHIWAHNTSFLVTTIGCDDQVLTIDTFMVGSVLTKTESFCVKLPGRDPWIGSFSPTVYCVSISVDGCLMVLDIRNSECLLEPKGCFGRHCFSPDGSLFAASLANGIHIWRYTSSTYTPWRELQTQDLNPFYDSPLLFSPTLSSILYCFAGILRVLHFDGSLIGAYSNNHRPVAALSWCGTYIATSHKGGTTVTITNLYLQTPCQFIDTGVEIYSLALTGNVLLVTSRNKPGYEGVMAWRLTENGVVDGVFADRRAGHGESIWNLSGGASLRFLIGDQVVSLELESTALIHHTSTGEVAEFTTLTYCTSTGQILKSTRAPPHSHSWEYITTLEMRHGRHYPNYCSIGQQSTLSKDGWLVSKATLEEGWVKDPEGMHQLWIPVEWRSPSTSHSGWFHNIKTLWLDLGPDPVIIMF